MERIHIKESQLRNMITESLRKVIYESTKRKKHTIKENEYGDDCDFYGGGKTYDCSGMNDIQSFVYTSLLNNEEDLYRIIVKDCSPQTLKELYSIIKNEGYFVG